MNVLKNPSEKAMEISKQLERDEPNSFKEHFKCLVIGKKKEFFLINNK